MRAIVASEAGAPAALGDRAEPDGHVLTALWSSLNYKDALALRGRPGVLRSLPLVPGIDVVGRDAAGEVVVVTGAGLGERTDGGLAERVAIDPATAVPVPAPFTPQQAAGIGTAGVTAALAVAALERDGLPDGPVLVTGAGGGVGGFAIALLAAAGREVHAATGRADAIGDHLRALGASRVVDRLPAEPGRPLQKAVWAGVVDSLGGGALVNAIAQTLPGGTVAACGLAASPDLPGTVLPFILRGATLAGIFSVDLPAARRRAAWDLLAERIDGAVVDRLTERVVELAEAPAVAEDVLAGAVRGRVVVRIAP
ncbi:zinc-binding dehydrogenase [Amnibacterium kyonggiense]|uniref:Acrylyl-CoA reductase (NADPH) n=1 Tax=Amnibacterium kyonggiense TaxID=595671 RepID=A0A4R7FQ40_9MICO|nr:zinc-binding dehydrogenase [Amnibacterium kyonggiense]TDS79778.1 acrylyl-CoA reductase (NADPH) [Amnibacterium kyonggiense]